MLLSSGNCKHFAVPSRKPKPCPSRTTFGRNIAQLRKSRKLTQEVLAEQCGLSARYFQSLEAGEYFPPLATLIRLRKALDATWEQLFEDCD